MMDHKSVPGVVCQVTEHNNYRIVCKGGMLKDCLMRTRFQVEPIKRAEHYGLSDALQDWDIKPNFLIREALQAISMVGGQGFFFCNCTGSCDANAKRMEGHTTVSVTLPMRSVSIKQLRLRVLTNN